METTSFKAPPALLERDMAAVWTEPIETLLSSDTRLVAADAIRPKLEAILNKEDDDDRLDNIWVDDSNTWWCWCDDNDNVDDFGSIIRWSGGFILFLFLEDDITYRACSFF